MTRTVTFKGTPLTLAGRAIEVGAKAPDFRATARDLKEVSLAEFHGKTKVITSFPSIDTPVCDLQVKEFNRRAASFSRDVAVIGVSMDLPFAQNRFCEAHTIGGVTLLSDYRRSSFGLNYGLLVRELGLLARAVIIIDRHDILRYRQVVPELTHAPDYEEAVEKLVAVLEEPPSFPHGEVPGRCVPCEGKVPPLSAEEIAVSLARRTRWRLEDGKRIVREFSFPGFAAAKEFLDIVALLAEEQGHHPAMTLSYRSLRVSFSTHAAGGLTANDFIMAGIVDELDA